MDTENRTPPTDIPGRDLFHGVQYVRLLCLSGIEQHDAKYLPRIVRILEVLGNNPHVEGMIRTAGAGSELGTVEHVYAHLDEQAKALLIDISPPAEEDTKAFGM